MFAVFDIADYKLTDLLSSAAATIGVILAGTIFLQFLSSKYGELIARYRLLTGEYRGQKGDEPRHLPLRSQIQLYHRQLGLLNRASLIAGLALLCLLTAVISGGLSQAFTQLMVLRTIGTLGLLGGLTCMFTSVVLEVWEITIARHELKDEVLDLDDEVKSKK